MSRVREQFSLPTKLNKNGALIAAPAPRRNCWRG